MKKATIVAHKFLPQPDDDLVIYLNQKGYKISHIRHSFPEAKDRKSSVVFYSNHQKTKEIKTIDFSFLPEIFIYLKEFFYTVKWTLFSNRKTNVYIGMDGLCTLFGLFLRNCGACQKVIYWCIDFVPRNRFGSFWKDFIYRLVNILALKKADEVWDLSPRMIEGRSRYWGVKRSDYQNHRIVPYGVWIDTIKKVPYEKCQKKTLVFMGHLMPKQGVEMVIRKMPGIMKKIPDFKFKIIGDGKYKKALMKLSQKLSLERNVVFLGKLESGKMEEEIAKSAVAIAPYRQSLESYTYFADPGKVKTYLACGVPVLLTNLPWNAFEIVAKKCGFIINDNGNDLLEKLTWIMDPAVNREFRVNAIRYSKNFDYSKVFSKLEI